VIAIIYSSESLRLNYKCSNKINAILCHNRKATQVISVKAKYKTLYSKKLTIAKALYNNNKNFNKIRTFKIRMKIFLMRWM
jgi:hypothetical protein